MSMNKDQVKGRVKEVEGKMKEVAGKVVGNEKLEAKGKVQTILGKAQARFGDVRHDAPLEGASGRGEKMASRSTKAQREGGAGAEPCGRPVDACGASFHRRERVRDPKP